MELTEYNPIEEIEHLVDELGALKAKIADLEKQESALKKQLIASGVTNLEGELFRVTITKSIRESLDMEAVKAKLSPQFLRAHTRETEYTTVRVSARKGEE